MSSNDDLYHITTPSRRFMLTLNNPNVELNGEEDDPATWFEKHQDRLNFEKYGFETGKKETPRTLFPSENLDSCHWVNSDGWVRFPLVDYHIYLIFKGRVRGTWIKKNINKRANIKVCSDTATKPTKDGQVFSSHFVAMQYVGKCCKPCHEAKKRGEKPWDAPDCDNCYRLAPAVSLGKVPKGAFNRVQLFFCCIFYKHRHLLVLAYADMRIRTTRSCHIRIE